MSRDQIKNSIQRYQLNVRQDSGNTGLFLAWYDELPGCMVEGPDRAAALEELDLQVVGFVEGIIGDGGKLPIPYVNRPRKPVTHLHTVSQVVIGNVHEILGSAAGHTTTSLESRPKFFQKSGDSFVLA